MCLQNKCFKDNVKPENWFGHLKLISLYIDEFFKITPKFDKKQGSVTGNTEEEENAAENTTDDSDKNEEANEIIDKNNEKVVTIEEEKKTLKYQETINLDIEKNSSTSQKF